MTAAPARPAIVTLALLFISVLGAAQAMAAAPARASGTYSAPYHGAFTYSFCDVATCEVKALAANRANGNVTGSGRLRSPTPAVARHVLGGVVVQPVQVPRSGTHRVVVRGTLHLATLAWSSTGLSDATLWATVCVARSDAECRHGGGRSASVALLSSPDGLPFGQVRGQDAKFSVEVAALEGGGRQWVHAAVKADQTLGTCAFDVCQASSGEVSAVYETTIDGIDVPAGG